LGLLRMRQGRHAEARKLLERAVGDGTQNYLIHYYYAYALSQVGIHDMEEVMGMAPENATIIRRELKRAIELRPDFLESYSLLAFVNLATGTDLDQTMEVLKQVLAGAPHRNDLKFMLAQLYLRRKDFKPARELTDKLIAEGDADIRERAQRLLAQLVSVEELTRINKDTTTWEAGSRDDTARDRSGVVATETRIETPFDPAAALRQSLRKPLADEAQVQGMLTRIDCGAKTITFVVRVGDRVLKLNTDTFQHAHIVSFSDDAGRQITCGLRKPQNNVVVAYVPAPDTRLKIEGVLKSVEFVPPDFKLKP
jgi:FimV-like protein